MKAELAFLIIAVGGLSLSACAAQRPYLRTEEEVSALRSQRSAEAAEKALRSWARYVDMSDEETWALVPGPMVFRAISVNPLEGCPNCGRKAFEGRGFYGFNVCGPWKIKCASCGEIFPKNDFFKFYKSGLGPDGLFDPERADRSLLFNTEHPDPKDPLHLYGVDDGTGYAGKDGHAYRLVAFYCAQWWTRVSANINSMASDYVRTGEPKLAHKVGILLARMADINPDLDYFTQGYEEYKGRLGGECGKAIRGGWGPGRMRRIASAYDDIWDIFDHDPDLVQFLTARAKQCGHPEWAGSAAAVRNHIEQDLLAENARAIIRHRAKGSPGQHLYGGDRGDAEYTVALTGAVVDDETTRNELLEWPFALPFPKRGGLHVVFSGPIIGREGAGGSSAPNYSSTHYKMGRKLADLYLSIQGPQHRDLYADYPPIKRSYETEFASVFCGGCAPHIGDFGLTGNLHRLCRPAAMLEAFEKFGDIKYAQMAYFVNHHSTDGLSEETAKEVEAIIKQHGEIERGSTNLNGYGLAILRSGTGLAEQQRAAWLYYGCGVTNSHTHYDGLNIGLMANGLHLMPDLGYPERTGAWPKRWGWTSHTISHNTVLVDAAKQKRAVVGNMNLFCRSPLVRLIDVSREAVYPQTSLYRRAYAMIDISDGDSYLVDIFRVKGGKDHHFSFHSAEGDVVTEGLKFEQQATGTLAGPDIEFAEYRDGKAGWSYAGSGFQYLRNVERDTSPPEKWSVEWQIKDSWNTFGQGRGAPSDVRLRLTMLGAHNEVILADGEPPFKGIRKGKPKNPQSLKYLVVHNSGDDVASVYASIIEPYQGTPNLKSIRRLPVEPAADDIEGMEAVALEIKHGDGVIDYVLSAHDGSVTRQIGDITFAGQWGFVRTRNGKTEAAYLIAGTLLSGNDFKLELPVAEYEGTITDMDTEMDEHNCIYTDVALPLANALAGNWIDIANDGGQDAGYEIKEIRLEDGHIVIDLGDITFIRSVKDPENYEAGYTYNFEVGDSFTIPAMVWMQRDAEG